MAGTGEGGKPVGSSSSSGTLTPEAQSLSRNNPADASSYPFMADNFTMEDLDGQENPPAYGEQPDHLQFSQPGLDAGAEVTDNGRVNINIKTTNRRLRDILAPVLDQQASIASRPTLPPGYIPPHLGGEPGQLLPPKLNVVVQIVGSRGDVQPFVALGKVLKDTYGHRVRIATHPTFQTFVEENGLEFFSIGGDPAELMAFMVKHPGLMPGMDAIKTGEITRRRKGIKQMLLGCWRSCIEAGNGLGPAPPPHAKNAPLDLSRHVSGDDSNDPFVADAIIANPPSFAHIHIAEKLGIPLHMMFTMPWSPTRAFPHPLANIQSSNADDVMTNFMTYTLVEMMTWQGLGDIINRFREKVLDLSPLSLIWAPGLLNRLKVSYTYCWSPTLIPKPNDWGSTIDIAGFYFLNLASSYTPDPDLAAFLDNGPPPVYIGFGSIVVDDPNAMTRMIFDAVRLSGVRALVSKGWGGLGADDIGVPEGVFMLGNVPHDWLFQKVSCVVHHGGAGTTAAGIKAGKPTIVVPFFGDQPFWGAMIARAKAGPDPIPYSALTAEKLAEAIKFCLKPDAIEQARQLGERIREEDGTDMGGKSFHKHLPIDLLRCSLAPSRTAAWRVRRTQVRLSPFAASVLVEKKMIEYSDLKLYRAAEYNTEDQPPDPISACACSLVMDMSSIGMAIADMPLVLMKSRQRVVEKNGTRQPKREATADSTAGPSDTTPITASSVSTSGVSTPKTTDTSSLETSAVENTGDAPSQKSLGKAIASAEPPSPSNSTFRGRARATSQHLKDAFNNRDRSSSPVDISLEAVAGTAGEVNRIVATGMKSPMNFCLGLAKGFRNMPRLYHDDTVRPVEKVTDFNSGLRVAGKELGLGFFDGIAGLVTQPLRGAEKEGYGGLVKGFGKGIGGLIAKPAAGFWGVPAYTMQGVHAEINKFFTRSSQNYIIASRVTQGQREMSNATEEEKSDVVARWNDTKSDLKSFYVMKDKTLKRASVDLESSNTGAPLSPRSRTSWYQKSPLSFDGKQKVKNQKATPTQGNASSSTATSGTGDDSEFERAIQASVSATSRGDATEDSMIEAAIRNSVNAIRQRSAASGPQAELPEKASANLDEADYEITDEEYQALIGQAIQQSLGQYSGETRGDATQAAAEDDDADLQRAIAESRKVPPVPAGHSGEDEDDELQRAIAASKEHMEKEQGQQTEEDIVLEYVRKQSLAEEEFRKKAGQQAGPGTEEHDEELRQAIEESLKLNQGQGQETDDAGPSRAA